MVKFNIAIEFSQEIKDFFYACALLYHGILVDKTPKKASIENSTPKKNGILGQKAHSHKQACYP